MIEVKVSDITVNMRVVQRYVETSPRVVAVNKAIMKYVMAMAIRRYNELELGHSTSPYHYVRSFRIDVPGLGVVRLANTDPTAVMVERGGHARGVTPVLGYGPMRYGVDQAVAKWRVKEVPI